MIIVRVEFLSAIDSRSMFFLIKPLLKSILIRQNILRLALVLIRRRHLPLNTPGHFWAILCPDFLRVFLHQLLLRHIYLLRIVSILQPLLGVHPLICVFKAKILRTHQLSCVALVCEVLARVRVCLAYHHVGLLVLGRAAEVHLLRSILWVGSSQMWLRKQKLSSKSLAFESLTLALRHLFEICGFILKIHHIFWNFDLKTILNFKFMNIYYIFLIYNDFLELTSI